MKLRSVISILILLLIAAVPWAIDAAFTPLQPSELAQTPTYYAPTEAAYLTREAVPSTTTFSIIGADGSLTPMATIPDSSPKIVAQGAATNTLPAPSTIALSATATIPLPVARQPTQTPIAIRVDLTEARALELMNSDFPELRDPSITISPDEIRLNGTVGPAGPFGQGLTIAGMVRLEANKLVMDVSYVELNGRDVTNEDTGQRAAQAANLWLQSIQVGQQVQSYTVIEGAVIYDALQSQEPVLPTPVGQVGDATEEPFLILPEDTPTLLQPANDIPLPQTTALGGSLFGTLGTPAPTTDGVPIPQAVEVTATYGADVTVEPAPEQQFTGEDFTGMSLGPLGNVRVSFIEDGIVVTGQISSDSSVILPGLSTGGEIGITAHLETRNGHLVAVPERITINGQSTAIPGFAEQLTTALNTWLANLTDGTVNGFALTDGTLTINPEVTPDAP